MEQPLRILLLNSGRKWIGEAAHSFLLARELQRRGHYVVLGARRDSELLRKIRDTPEMPGAEFHFTSRFHPFCELSDMRRIRELLAEHQLQIVLVNRGKDHWLAAAARLRYRGSWLILRTRHVVVPMKNHAFNRWLLRHGTDALTGVSTPALASVLGVAPDAAPPDTKRARSFERFGLNGLNGLDGQRSNAPPDAAPDSSPDAKRVRLLVRCILSAVDLDEFHPRRRSDSWRAAVGVQPGEFLIGQIGRFQNVKGQADFLAAAGSLNAKFPQRLRFLLAGAGSEEKIGEYREFARRAGIAERLIVLGRREDINTAIAALDAGVIASRDSEGSSRVCLEFLASGVPQVATRVGGIPELLAPASDGTAALGRDSATAARNGAAPETESFGLLVEPRAPEQLAGALERLIADPALRRRLAQNGRARAEREFNFDRWTAEYTALIRAVLESATP